MTAAKALLNRIIDYAGMFPPAALSARDAVAAYRQHQDDPRAWLLGPLVVAAPAVEALSDFTGDVSVIVGLDVERQLALALAHHARVGAGTRVAIEFAPQSAALIESQASRIPRDVTVFFETPPDDQMIARLDAIQRCGAGAKIRTGGTSAAAFPSAEQVYRFFRACAERRLRCKATAGLHHAMTGTYALTYDASSERSRMFGFLNVCTAAALAHAGAAGSDGVAALDERDPAAITFGDDWWQWRDWRWSTGDIERLRSELFRSFGSCSFGDPADELDRLGII